MKKLYFLLILLTGLQWSLVVAQNDKATVERLLQQARTLPVDSSRTLFFARQLSGIPYVAGTLDEDAEEVLVVHLDRADCTTLVETVLALSLADKRQLCRYDDFRAMLQLIRYRDGVLNGYASRLHYFSDWIKNNEQKGIVRERTAEWSQEKQLLNLNFMSTHPDSYRQLKNNPRMTEEIARQEQAWHRVEVFYIPKEKLGLPQEELNIRNGDILAITTRIDGLDVVHTGFAFWQDGKVHLLHASSVAKRVIADPQPLYEYSKNKKAHTGVRVISFLP